MCKTQSIQLPSQCITLTPVLVTPRSCLPLAYLDLSGDTNGFPGTQLFCARIPALESILQENLSDQPVLIAEACTTKASLYAIERVDGGLYALCMLGEWVTVKALEQLQAASIKMPARRQPCYHRINPQDSDWWRDLAVKDAGDTRGSAGYETEVSRRVRLCLKVPRPETSSPMSARAQLPACATQEPVPMNVKDPTDEVPQEPSTQTPEEVFSMLRTQYQQTLYISKVKLVDSCLRRC